MPEPELRQLLTLIDTALGVIRRSNLEALSVPEIKAHLALLDARRHIAEHLQRVSAIYAVWGPASETGPTERPTTP